MKPSRRRDIALAVAYLALCALVLGWCAQPSAYNVAHDAAVKTTLDALDAHRQQKGRYPKDLSELQPPPVFHPEVELRYVSTDAGDACWVAYDTQHTFMPSDTFIETECGTRQRQVLEYGEAKTTPRPGVTTFPAR